MREIGIITCIIMFFLAIQPLHGQIRENETDFSTELVWGINKNSNGGLIGGVFAKYSLSMTERMSQYFALEIANIKHPKEVRYSSFGFGTPFIYGKSNYLYSFRPQYGRDLVLFKKAPEQGVQISLSLGIGPSLGIVAPYYIQYNTSQDQNQSQFVQFDPARHSLTSIQGSGRLFQGIGESELAFGGNAKIGLNFEVGTFKSHVTGFEIGATLEAFTREIVIMPRENNRAIFPAIYLSLFYGTRK